MMFSETTSEYEQGFILSDGSYYESHDHSVTFPEGVTIQEAFLFARNFFNTLKTRFPEYPVGPGKEEFEGGQSLEVTAENGNIIKIIAVTGDGCYEEEGVQVSLGVVKMSANGGC